VRVPNHRKAIVEERKVRDYLLSGSHPVGRFKARFFAGLGFDSENWSTLQGELRQVAARGEAQLVQESMFGRKYLVLGTVTGPKGRTAEVATIWIIRSGDDTPRLVTVYPT
jgi:Domain of unknown function (DUF6883)